MDGENNKTSEAEKRNIPFFQRYSYDRKRRYRTVPIYNFDHRDLTDPRDAKDWPRPTRSYGIILYHLNSLNSESINKEIKFLVCKRRDSYHYQSLIRGKWDSEEELISRTAQLTLEERERILAYNFEEIWDDFWPDHSSDGYLRNKESLKASFEVVKSKLKSLELEKLIPVDNDHMWGFPKGKKNIHTEDSIKTAMREFIEETKLKEADIEVYNTNFIEKYKGTDNQLYQTTYFLAKYLSNDLTIPEPEKYPGRIRDTTHTDETETIRWVTFEEAKGLLNDERINLLKEILKELLNDDSLDYSNGKKKFVRSSPPNRTFGQAVCERGQKTWNNIHDVRKAERWDSSGL